MTARYEMSHKGLLKIMKFHRYFDDNKAGKSKANEGCDSHLLITALIIGPDALVFVYVTQNGDTCTCLGLLYIKVLMVSISLQVIRPYTMLVNINTTTSDMVRIMNIYGLIPAASHCCIFCNLKKQMLRST